MTRFIPNGALIKSRARLISVDNSPSHPRTVFGAKGISREELNRTGQAAVSAHSRSGRRYGQDGLSSSQNRVYGTLRPHGYRYITCGDQRTRHS